MLIEAIRPVTSMWNIDRAHDSINAAYNAIAVDRRPATLVHDVGLARGYLHEARAEVAPAAGHDGPDDATRAARAVLPRLDHALVLLDALEAFPDAQHIEPLLNELWIAMDHVEDALAAVGWD